MASWICLRYFCFGATCHKGAKGRCAWEGAVSLRTEGVDNICRQTFRAPGSSRAVGVVGFGAVSGFGSDPGLLAQVSGPGHVARRLGEGREKRGAPGTVTSHAVIAALIAFNEYPLSPRNETSVNLESPLPSDAS